MPPHRLRHAGTVLSAWCAFDPLYLARIIGDLQVTTPTRSPARPSPTTSAQTAPSTALPTRMRCCRSCARTSPGATTCKPPSATTCTTSPAPAPRSSRPPPTPAPSKSASPTRKNWPAATPPAPSAPPCPRDPVQRAFRASRPVAAAAGSGRVLRRARAGAYRSAGGRHADHLAAESGCRAPRAEIPAVITIRPAELAPHPMSGPTASALWGRQPGGRRGHRSCA